MTASAGRLLSGIRRRTAILILLLAALASAICWYLGTDVWHAVLFGCVLTTVGLAGSARLDPGATEWSGVIRRSRDGARNDVAELSWSLRGRWGHVSDRAVWRVQELARRRLAAHRLNLRDANDRRAIEQLIGSRAYVVLARRPGARPPSRRTLVHCLDVLDALAHTEPQARP